MTRNSRTGRRVTAGVVLGLIGVTVLGACSSGSSATSEQSEPAEQGWEHVHNLAVDGGRVLLGTHEGLWQQQPGQQPMLASDAQFDVMGLTQDGSRWLASGHPGHGDEGPADLGLLQSTDGGRTWQPVSLSGEVDFHRLAASGSTIVGLSAHDGALLRSIDDGVTWSNLGSPPLFDIALDPTDGATIVATTETGLVRSTDGGVTFTPIDGAPLLALLAWSDAGLVGIDPAGQLYRSRRAGQSWTRAGDVGGEPTALAASPHTVTVLTGTTLLVSSDGGDTFTSIADD